MSTSRKQLLDVCDDDTIQTIYRLFKEPLSTPQERDGEIDGELCRWYCPPGGVVNCNALLQIADDGSFIDAAVWQIHGQETAGRQRRRWLKRLRWSSRMGLIIGMRFKTAGRRHAVKIPGLWLATLLNPPGYRSLAMGPVGRLLDSLRHKVVAWRYHRRMETRTARLGDPTDEHSNDGTWRRAS